MLQLCTVYFSSIHFLLMTFKIHYIILFRDRLQMFTSFSLQCCSINILFYSWTKRMKGKMQGEPVPVAFPRPPVQPRGASSAFPRCHSGEVNRADEIRESPHNGTQRPQLTYRSPLKSCFDFSSKWQNSLTIFLSCSSISAMVTRLSNSLRHSSGQLPADQGVGSNGDTSASRFSRKDLQCADPRQGVICIHWILVFECI